ncbi:MAG: helix-turn-helix domain-containing protein [Sphaerochaetaceae bacterium]|nr:helix-turn-helix domain-containing protein [Spirochaetales bacterium]MDY5500315.1 helix-turn-helix domain-containing protein [Sphaerochaetaceae bacterium]MDY6344285.1 helix-turn-helix domain-containing protein [Sphaerochaetaceae bacterium]
MANEQKCSSLDAKQAGELLGVKESTIRKWVLERSIPYHKLGRLVRFDSQELAEFWGQSKREPIGREVN